MNIFKVALCVLIASGFFSCKGSKEQPQQRNIDLEQVTQASTAEQLVELDTTTESNPQPVDNRSAPNTTVQTTPARMEKPVIAVPSRKPNKTTQDKPVLPPPAPLVGSPKVKLDDQTPSPPQKQSDKLPDHTPFHELLQKYVDANGKVNYTNLKKNRKALDAYLTDMATASNITKWSREEQLAYWINLYNAATLQMVIDNFPLKSIKDASFGKPWDTYFIKVGAVTYTLNEVENNIIRKQFNDPRIHFAVNCAAKSCPPLLNKAYTAANVDKLLQTNTKAFVNSSYNDISAKSVAISDIFKWFAEDFGEIITFINQYSNTKTAKDATITYKDYDWSLNGY